MVFVATCRKKRRPSGPRICTTRAVRRWRRRPALWGAGVRHLVSRRGLPRAVRGSLWAWLKQHEEARVRRRRHPHRRCRAAPRAPANTTHCRHALRAGATGNWCERDSCRACGVGRCPTASHAAPPTAPRAELAAVVWAAEAAAGPLEAGTDNLSVARSCGASHLARGPLGDLWCRFARCAAATRWAPNHRDAPDLSNLGPKDWLGDLSSVMGLPPGLPALRALFGGSSRAGRFASVLRGASTTCSVRCTSHGGVIGRGRQLGGASYGGLVRGPGCPTRRGPWPARCAWAAAHGRIRGGAGHLAMACGVLVLLAVNHQSVGLGSAVGHPCGDGAACTTPPAAARRRPARRRVQSVRLHHA